MVVSVWIVELRSVTTLPTGAGEEEREALWLRCLIEGDDNFAMHQITAKTSIDHFIFGYPSGQQKLGMGKETLMPSLFKL